MKQGSRNYTDEKRTGISVLSLCRSVKCFRLLDSLSS